MRRSSCVVFSTVSVIGATVWFWLAGPCFAADVRRPNVIMVFVDDQGSVDAGCYGAPDLETPALDGLAKRGVRFTQFYAAAPVCSPSRASLMTGRYPLRVGLTTNTDASDPPVNGVFPTESHGMPGSEVTMAETFKAAGYATAFVGKWHLGASADTLPGAQGFDHAFGFLGACIDNYSHFFYWRGPNRHDLWRNETEVHHDGEFFPDLMVREARQFMEKNRERPFFLYYALNAPHYPYQGSEKWLEHYRRMPYPRRYYAAFLSTMDENVGRLLKEVDALGLRDNTIIAYQSDNGHSTEVRAHGGGGNSGPYRGAKFSLFEGGIRLPAVISWPGRLPEGEARSQMAHGCDWLPTLAELARVDLLQPDVDGKSLARVIQSNDAETPHKILHWQVGRGRSLQWAVRKGDWKLIANVRDTGDKKKRMKLSPVDKRYFLANLAEDIGETRNYAADHPKLVKQLRDAHEEWAEQVKADKAKRDR